MKAANGLAPSFTPAFKRSVTQLLKKEPSAVVSLVRFYLYDEKSQIAVNVSPEDLARAQILSSVFRTLS